MDYEVGEKCRAMDMVCNFVMIRFFSSSFWFSLRAHPSFCSTLLSVV